MVFTDTHTHIYMPEFDGERQQAVRRAIDAGVTRMIFPNIDRGTIAPMKELATQFPANVSMAMGLHPSEVNGAWEEDTAAVLAELDANPHLYKAVGEVGIDLYWDKTFEKEQMLSLEQQFRAASRLGMPVIIHCRKGLGQTLEVLREFPDVKCVFHCFGGCREEVEQIRRVGDHYFGIGGIVTFKNCKLGSVLPEIGLDRIVLETDSPYLAPVPYRGKRNESAYIPIIAQKVAEALDAPVEKIADATTANATALFRL